MLQQRWKYFNSLPHAEVDAEYDVISSGASKFQLTTSRRGRPECGIRIFYQYSYFNSLPHAEVDGGGFGGNGGNGTFQLTTSRRGRRLERTGLCRSDHFNSLPHAEVDISICRKRAVRKNFNSLPHAEVDLARIRWNRDFEISTHYLTQR